MNLKVYHLLIFFFIFLLGTFLRIYNSAYDDLWYDEVISFWITNPNFSLNESFYNHNLIEVNTYSYHFLLKIIFQYFGYSVEVGRLFSVIMSSLSILSVSYLVYYISKNKSYIFASFLISFNIFLISFSQEMRLYSLLFFFVSLSIIFFLRSIEEKKKSDLIFFFLITTIAISLHAFALIILFSFMVNLFLQYIKYKKIHHYLNFIFLIILIISLILYFYSFITAASDNTSDYFWMENPDLKFFTNFYFSSFFGSRFMGALFLIIFLALTFFNLKKKNNSVSLELFIIILLFSYSLPIIFGYLFKPILVNRYIIFVLIPIISIIATTTFHLSKKNSYLVAFILIIATLGNHFTEQTFKQFTNQRVVSKPEYKLAILHMNNSNYKEYSLRVVKMKSNEASISAINNYINYLNKKINTDVKFISLSNNLENKIFWYVCLQDINGKNCSINNRFKNVNILQEKNFNNINIKLLKVY